MTYAPVAVKRSRWDAVQAVPLTIRWSKPAQRWRAACPDCAFVAADEHVHYVETAVDAHRATSSCRPAVAWRAARTRLLELTR